MLRVGLTGGLGSGKSTVAVLLRERGFPVLEADAIARAFMEPGQPVFRAIVEHFGSSVRRADGALDRPRLADLVFNQGRLAELNRLVHPPVVAEQERRMEELFARDSRAVVFVESALIFEAEAWGTVPEWRRRFDRVVLVTAPDDLKIQRFLMRILPADASPEERIRAERDARARLAAQLPDSVKVPRSDAVIDNAGSPEATRSQVDRLAARLRAEGDAQANADRQEAPGS
ncbi:MAG TPA: dephospho-CoA kinase [Acidobacteriaceae bacterium]|jgi:dephospho-CoA kinase|nr:dephospho-CoA kinase [Acidobacteriaceae bacterium]